MDWKIYNFLAKRNKLFLKVLSESNVCSGLCCTLSPLKLVSLVFHPPTGQEQSAAVWREDCWPSDGCWRANIFSFWFCLSSLLGFTNLGLSSLQTQVDKKPWEVQLSLKPRLLYKIKITVLPPSVDRMAQGCIWLTVCILPEL